jgi:hypothetical protein
MTPIDISLDLETLATTPDAVILTIGIVDSLGGSLILAPSVEQQVAEGRRVEDDTLRWWWRQGPDAHAALQRPVTSFGAARVRIAAYFGDFKAHDYRVWGNAPSFDCEILGHFLGEKPWPYYRERCVRTAREILGERTQPRIAHCAISDAQAQLHDVRRYRQLAHRVDLEAEHDALRSCASEALEAYRGIVGPNCWNQNDRYAFANLERILAGSPSISLSDQGDS